MADPALLQPAPAAADPALLQTALAYPRVTIRFCTQCKWMLRAAYFGQELLSTFSTALGEVALQPSTGGTFVVSIEYYPPVGGSPSTQSLTASAGLSLQQRTLWDRKIDGGFPETKELKRRVRDAIEPNRDLGHVDRDHHAKGKSATAVGPAAPVSALATEQGKTQPQQSEDKKVAGALQDPSSIMPELQQQQPGENPLSPRWPRHPDDGHGGGEHQPQEPRSSPDPLRKGHSQPMIRASPPPPPEQEKDGGDESGQHQQLHQQRSYKELPSHGGLPHMPGGGIMPVAPPTSAESNERVLAALETRDNRHHQQQQQQQRGGGQEECEDCQ
ncbi:Rdx family-domain-containing protein [Xylariales sp. PMI_506]|nr:Rdx family-domain-containing protein [Xylariales sp. PMI_506]